MKLGSPINSACYLCRNQALISLSFLWIASTDITMFHAKIFEETLEGYEKANAKVETCLDSSGFIAKWIEDSRNASISSLRCIGQNWGGALWINAAPWGELLRWWIDISPGYVSSSDLMFEKCLKLKVYWFLTTSVLHLTALDIFNMFFIIFWIFYIWSVGVMPSPKFPWNFWPPADV